MNTPLDRRVWIEALHSQNVAFRKLLEVILRLAQAHGKPFIVNTFGRVLERDPVEIDDCVVFGDIALRFDQEERLIDLYKCIDGTTKRAEVVIEAGREG